MTLLALYPSKKNMKEHIGQRLHYQETALPMFGPEYRSNGELTVCNRPQKTGLGKEWSGVVTMENDIIVKVK